MKGDLSFKQRILMRLEQSLFVVPSLVIGGSCIQFYFLMQSPSLFRVLLILFTIYGFPLLVFRCLNFFFPMQEGLFTIGRGGYNPWLGAFKIQVFYTTFPMFEKILMMIPGAFSLWLRLWGSHIGKRVYWAPGIEIVDRTHLKIGDRVFFGNKSYISPHVVRRKKDGRLQVYIKTIEIGQHSFVGAGSRLGPGTKVGEYVHLPMLTDLFFKQTVNSTAEIESTSAIDSIT